MLDRTLFRIDENDEEYDEYNYNSEVIKRPQTTHNQLIHVDYSIFFSNCIYITVIFYIIIYSIITIF